MLLKWEKLRPKIPRNIAKYDPPQDMIVFGSVLNRFHEAVIKAGRWDLTQQSRLTTRISLN
jgi:hypothetical protein